jgi:M-phase inducer tyrosine phosphatase
MDIDSSFVEGLAFPPKTDHAPSAPFTVVQGTPGFKNMFYDPSSPPTIRDDLHMQASSANSHPSSPYAMDIDSSFVEGLAFPPKTDRVPSAPFTIVQGTSGFKNMFYDPSSPPAIRDDLPVYLTKTRQLVSPEAGPEVAPGRRRAGTISIFDGSSPVADSSPSALKLERLANCMKKPMLNGLGVPSDNPAKHLWKPNLSAMVLPSDAAQLIQPLDVLQNDDSISALQGQNMGLPPPRRAFSAMLPQLGPKAHSPGESSIDHGDESSPALAYAKRQQIRTIRRRDGTDDFRSLKGATAMLARDKESPRARTIPQWGTGLGGFGDNEAHGKILPCHRVREDGLMRISCKTVSVFSLMKA